jgi:hypothetical protein
MGVFTENDKARLILISAVLLVAIIGISITHPMNAWNRLITGDGKGYYAYLPATFIYKDNQFTFRHEYEKKYYSPESYYDFTKLGGNKEVDKYFCGTALLVTPFFLAAHVIAQATGLPADGYHPIYQYAVFLGAMFYLFLGLWWLYLLLRRLGFRFWTSVGASLLALFGTNLFHYAIREPAMSHIYSFSLVCGFLYFSQRWFQERKGKDILWMGALLGLIVVLRPSNLVIVLFLPFLAGSWENLRSGIAGLFQRPLRLLSGFGLFIIPLAIQSALWYWQTGHWIIDSYGGERFYFNKPHFIDILFSYRKGWFLWTPLAFIGITGFFWYLREKPWRFAWAMGFFLLTAYVMSCWWQWYYGMSFGNRVFIDFLFLPAIGICLWHAHLSNRLAKSLFVIVCLCLLTLNQVQAYQHRKYILRWDMMTRSDYWRIFLKTGEEYEGFFWSKNEITLPQRLANPDKSFYFDFENSGQIAGDQHRVPGEGREESYAARVDVYNPFGPTWKARVDSVHINDSLIQTSLWFSCRHMPKKTALVTTVMQNGKPIFWQEKEVKHFYGPGKKWHQMLIQQKLLDSLPSGSEIQVFVWNKDTDEEVYIDDMQVDVFERK